jgi:ribose 5-phosphate isomerase B
VRIALASDEDAPAVAASVEHLRAGGHHVDVLAVGEPWAAVGRAVGEAVAEERADVGVVWCWTGTGVSIAANKVRGVRAALCADAETARGARRWNDANVVALSLRSTTATVAAEILDAFVAGRADPGEAAAVASVE